jgi:hypothetical protein
VLASPKTRRLAFDYTAKGNLVGVCSNGTHPGFGKGAYFTPYIISLYIT